MDMLTCALSPKLFNKSFHLQYNPYSSSYYCMSFHFTAENMLSSRLFLCWVQKLV